MQQTLWISLGNDKWWQPTRYQCSSASGRFAITTPHPEIIGAQEVLEHYRVYGGWPQGFGRMMERIHGLTKERDKAIHDLETLRLLECDTSRRHGMALMGLSDAGQDICAPLDALRATIDRIRDTKDVGIGPSKFLGETRKELQAVVATLEKLQRHIAGMDYAARFTSEAPRETTTRSGASGSIEFDLTLRRNPAQGGTSTDLPEE